MSEVKELVALPAKETALSVFTAKDGLEPWLQQIRAKVDEFNSTLPELTTLKGRKLYASMAYQIAQTKNALEEVGKKLSAEQKEVPKLIDAERKRVWDKLELWQKEVRKPLDDWQAAEDKRVQDHNDGIQRVKDLALFAETPTAAFVANVIEDLDLVELDDSWQEFLPEAAQAKDRSLATLRALLVTRQKYEAEQAELEKLREEKEARDKKDNEDRIAREAAEKAAREAEEKAKREREAQEQKARDEQAAAEKRELELKLQAEQAERKAAQANIDRLAAEERAEDERNQATIRQHQAAEQARLDEQARQQAAADEIIRQQKARQADVAHKSKILGAAKEAIMSMNVSEELAKAIVLKIARGEVPNTTINF